MKKDTRPKTIFCDIDGTLIKHCSPSKISESEDVSLLSGTLEKLEEWDSAGYNIILVTGRKESLRKHTERQLFKAGIIYDKLIMGIGGGTRYIVNDEKPDGTVTCYSISLKRNSGIKDIDI